MKLYSQQGFTLFETMIGVVIILILAAIVAASFVVLQQSSDLDNASQEFVSFLKLAQSNTLGSSQNSQYGMYINTATNQYTLFQGATYAGGTNKQVRSLPSTIEFSAVSLGGGNEIVFDKLTGISEQSGSITLRHKKDTTKTKNVYIATSGTIGFSVPVTASDSNRTKDSRHVHFDYSRVINTGTENIILTFDNTVSEVIIMDAFLSDGELDWSGTITVGGSPQVVAIRTHRLNSPDTQFSIHRDARYNNKSLKVTLSGDNSGTLAEYPANGATVTHTSIYASNVNWQ